jgi:Lar family restriction alleviation protein
MNEIKLKPCPFCGGEDLSIETDDHTGEYCIFCSKCGPACFDKYKIDSIHTWNSRVDSTAGDVSNIKELIMNQKELPAEFRKIIDENFWDLL